jgi:polysaccharide export outer membrane protein
MIIFDGNLRLLCDRRPLRSLAAPTSSKLLATIVGLTAACMASCAPQSSSSRGPEFMGAPAARVSDSAESNTGAAVEVRNASAGRELHGNSSLSSRTDENRAKLEALFSSRRADAPSDFTIGPGDILEVSVPAMDQLKAVDTRVLENGTIMLPLLGRVRVGGLTEEQAGDELRDRLKKYMHSPQFSMFVKKYQSREVSVMGALDKPGLYTLANPRETIISMIGKAGGLNDKAGSRVFLLASGSDASSPKPALAPDGSGGVSVDTAHDPTGSSHTSRDIPQRVTGVRTSAPLHAIQVNAADSIDGTDSLCIDVGKASYRKYLNIPARPGDLIIVSQAGQVAVQGWVQTPGAFSITPGMTLLGAVAAAGGELFSSKARILRTGDDGGPITEQANLRRIRNREESDIPVQAGDVVIVDKSVLGSGPYLLYTLFTKFNTGMYMPPP